MKRYGQMIKVKPGKLEEYCYHHANPWPEVNAMIEKCNIRNYSIFLKGDYLFAYFEYVGTDFETDMERMAQDKKTQEWWDVVKPCHIPLEDRTEGEWWSNMEEVYHLD